MSELINPTDSPLSSKTISNCFYELWEASAEHLTEKQLSWFAGFSDYAENQARNLADVVVGIGCLVASDDDAGSFQDKQAIATLLFSINQQLETISGLIHVSSSAADRLINPKMYRPET